MKNVSHLAAVFGSVISAERKRKGMSQKNLAEQIGSSNLYVSLLERGERKPSLNTLILIAQSLGMEPAELTGMVCEKLLVEQCPN